MTQYFKAVFFPDFPNDVSPEKSITLAFGEKFYDLFTRVQSLSSHELRNILGYQRFIDLENDAEREGLSINSYCISILKKKTMNMTPVTQMRFPDFVDDSVLGLDPIHTTFRGGQAEPLHAWYPYLEGYSPQFVEAVISRYAPNAQRILDPFSGTGTTPIAVAKLGKQAFYCEVNPLLQYLSDIKIQAYMLERPIREKIRSRLEALADNWRKLVENSLPDKDLASSYTAIFDKSEFFDAQTFDLILQSRTVLDKLSATEGFISDLATIAVIASLLASSKLIRAGDIRYRTGREKAFQVQFLEEVTRHLLLMAGDLAKLNDPPPYRPTLITEDAKKLNHIPSLQLDFVMTSPPYLNGTNYFRNTKIELWFLRSLRSKQELADYRYKAVTAGINDVTMGKVGRYIPEPLDEILKSLEENAYDMRIPKMVLSYFQDMELIFSNIRQHLTKNALVAIDLGDSIYGGIHVQTEKLLVEILKTRGFVLKDLLTLRKRLSKRMPKSYSREGVELSQVLILLEAAEDPKIAFQFPQTLSRSTYWTSRWSEFKKQLPHQKQPYAKRNWGSDLHSLCSYQGKMKPSLAHHLVNTFVPASGRMLDPFAGVGTIPFEAAQNGALTFGFEISPAALAISAAKIGAFKKTESDKLIDKLSEYLKTHEPTPLEYSASEKIAFNGSLSEYFDPETLKEILLARRFFLNHPPTTGSENLVLASMLHILHGNRPYALSRRSHPITPYKPTGPIEYRALIPRLREKVTRSIKAERSETFIPGKIFFQDATKWWPNEVDNLDAIITSPPFFDSTRFYIGNWMRLWFCGWEKQDFSVKPLDFVDERQKQSFAVYTPIFRQARERLKRGGVMVLHLGLSHKSDMAHELAQIANSWFKVEDIFVEDVTHVESHGIRDKGSVVGHQYLVLT